MRPPDSFHDLMARLDEGDGDAAREVFDRFVDLLVARADTRLGGRLRPKVSANDVVQSVFRSFFDRHGRGQLDLGGWESLRALLICMTVRKCVNVRRRYFRDRRDISREVASTDRAEGVAGLRETLDPEPTPEEAAMLADALEHLLDGLDSRDRRIIELRLQEYTPGEISDHVGCAERTVFRVLQRAKKRLAVLESSEA